MQLSWYSLFVPLLAILLIYLLSYPFTKGMKEQYARLNVPFRLNPSFFGIGWAIIYFLIYIAWVYLLSTLNGATSLWSYFLILSLVFNYFWIVSFSGTNEGPSNYSSAVLFVILNVFLISIMSVFLFIAKLYLPFWLMIIYLCWLLFATYQSLYVSFFN